MFQYPLPWHGGGGGDSMVYPWSTSGGETCGAGGGSCTLGVGGAGTGICMPGESGWLSSISQPSPGCMGSNDMGLIPICQVPPIPADS